MTANLFKATFVAVAAVLALGGSPVLGAVLAGEAGGVGTPPDPTWDSVVAAPFEDPTWDLPPRPGQA
ncbi:hypothetical protein ACGFYU_20770 [Streptomyces sp. NPDC048337]|uniref:hypothetical protein n=1 Tax=Streptomyces sp. NPDC048337 TaxID=3365535 RepID=UPI00371FA344